MVAEVQYLIGFHEHSVLILALWNVGGVVHFFDNLWHSKASLPVLVPAC